MFLNLINGVNGKMSTTVNGTSCQRLKKSFSVQPLMARAKRHKKSIKSAKRRKNGVNGTKRQKKLMVKKSLTDFKTRI